MAGRRAASGTSALMHTLRHLLAPGTPSYAILKLGAVAVVIGLQLALRRRPPEPADAPEPERRSSEPVAGSRVHPRSKKKRRRRH